VLLPDEVVERRRPQPLRQRRHLVEAASRSLGEEIAHARSMLPHVTVEAPAGTP
jgi:hypothetical protein